MEITLFFLFIVIIILFVRINTLSNKLIDLQRLYQTLQQRFDAFAHAKSTSLSSEKSIDSHALSNALPKAKSTITPIPLSDDAWAKSSPKESTFDSTIQIKTPSWIKNWFFTGNPIAKMGLLILFVGIAFLLKFTSQYFTLSIQLRLIGVSLSGLLMLALGWRLYQSKPLYGHILQGGGVGLLFITIYTSFAFYHLLAPVLAFGLLLALMSFCAFIAVIQDAKSFAIFAILGAFIAPLLISTGHDNHIVLFSYYAIINAAILGIAWFKSWRSLNTLGFVCTFIMSGLWGYTYYQTVYFYSTECFLLLFFVFYISISILYAAHKPGQFTGVVDTLLTFGLPISVFAYQLNLVQSYAHYVAWSAYGFGFFYSVLAGYLWIYQPKTMMLIREAFTAIAIIFFTMAIPLGFSNQLSAVLWALEGAAIVWIGLKQNHFYARIFGVLVQLGSAILFFSTLPIPYETMAILNNAYFNGLCIALAGLISAFCWYKYSDRCLPAEMLLAKILFAWGALWWYWIGFREISLHSSLPSLDATQLLFVTGSTLIAWTLSEKLNWPWLRYLFLILPLQMLCYAWAIDAITVHSQLTVWAFSFAVFYIVLYRCDRFAFKNLAYLHILSLWLLAWVLCYQLYQSLLPWSYSSLTWDYIACGTVLTGLLGLIRYGQASLRWPLQTHALAYQGIGGFGIAIVLIVGIFAANINLGGDVKPFMYLPLLNPLDIILALAFAVSLSWFIQRTVWLKETNTDVMNSLYVIYSILGFVFMTAVLLRTLHTILDIPYAFDDLWDSIIVQASLSIFWTLLALLLTFVAARAHWRAVWFAGVVLILIVILKLFMIDLSNSSTLARIITFISVGILLLINGYLSPLPPKDNESLK